MASDNTPIKGLIETSFIDWPGFMAAVLFTGGCNFRCPFCHNRDLVLNSASLPTMPFRSVLQRLKAHQGWVGRVVVTGGEPTMHKALPRTAGAAHGRPALVFALHLLFAVVCRFSGMGDTSSLTDPLGPNIFDPRAIWVYL